MKPLLHTLLMLISLNSFAQAPVISWITKGGFDAAANKNGDVYTIGQIEGDTAKYGKITLYHQYHNSNGLTLVRLAPVGNVVGGRMYEAEKLRLYPYWISIDTADEIFVGGFYSADDTCKIDQAVFTPSYNKAFFITKIDKNGYAKWARCIISPGFYPGPELNDMACSKNGDVAFAANYHDAIMLGNLKFTGSAPCFTAKFDNNGNLKWALSSGGTQSAICQPHTLSIDDEGNVYIGGSHSFAINFGSFNAPYPGPSSFIVKIDTAGIPVKMMNFKGAPTSITVDNDKSIYAAGGFADSIVFGTTQLKVTNSTSRLGGFLTKFDSSGNILWVKKTSDSCFSVPGDWKSSAVCFNQANDSIYLTGSNNRGCMLFKFDKNGNSAGYTHHTVPPDTTGYMNPTFIKTNLQGHVYIAGNFKQAIVVNKMALTDGHFFLLKIGEDYPNSVPIIGDNSSVLQIFPNPVSRTVTIQSKIPIKAVVVYDQTGRLILSNQFVKHATSTQVDVSSLPTGTYILKAQGDKQLYTEKLVIEH